MCSPFKPYITEEILLKKILSHAFVIKAGEEKLLKYQDIFDIISLILMTAGIWISKGYYKKKFDSDNC